MDTISGHARNLNLCSKLVFESMDALASTLSQRGVSAASYAGAPALYSRSQVQQLDCRKQVLTLCNSEVCRGVEQTEGPSALICQSLTLLSREQLIRCRSVTHAAPKSQSLWPCARVKWDIVAELDTENGTQLWLHAARLEDCVSSCRCKPELAVIKRHSRPVQSNITTYCLLSVCAVRRAAVSSTRHHDCSLSSMI